MLTDFFNFIRPPDDATPERIRRWRWNVAAAVLAGFIFSVWTLTPWGFALAQTVDQKVTAAVKPLQEELAGVKKSVDDLTDETKVIKQLLLHKLSADLEREIVDAKRRQCKAATVDEADYFRGQEQEKQVEYLDLVHREFKVPNCVDL